MILLAIEDVTEEHSLRTQQKTAIEALQRTEESLRATIEEKTMLVREVHHRVRNNFQVIEKLARSQV